MVATSRAKSKIRHWLNTQQAVEAAGDRPAHPGRELKKLRLNPKKVFESPRAAEYLQREGLAKIDDLCQRIAFGKIQWKSAIDAMVEPEQLQAGQEPPGTLRRVVEKLLPASGPLLIMGHGDLMSSLALCCRPVPGEPVIGYVTRGRGITVHAVDCPNLTKLAYETDRMVEVEWGKPSSAVTYPVELMIGTEDQQGMLARLTDVIAREHSNIRMFEAEATETGHGRIQVMVEVQDAKHLERLCRAVRGVPGVLQVDRVVGAAAGATKAVARKAGAEPGRRRDRPGGAGGAAPRVRPRRRRATPISSPVCDEHKHNILCCLGSFPPISRLGRRRAEPLPAALIAKRLSSILTVPRTAGTLQKR